MPIERRRAVAQPGLDDRARHAVDHAALFGFGEDTARPGLDPCRAFAAVGAHAGHDDAEHARAVDVGGGLKQHVDRRPVRRVERPDVEVRARRRPPSRRNVRCRPAGARNTMPGAHALRRPSASTTCSADSSSSLLRVQLSVADRHVQHDRDRHRADRPADCGISTLQRLRPAGRDADDHDVDRAPRLAACGSAGGRRAGAAAGGRSGAAPRPSPSRPARRRSRAAGRWPARSASARSRPRPRRARPAPARPTRSAMLMMTIGTGRRAICARDEADAVDAPA